MIEPNDLFNRVYRFLNQQRELFGDFSIKSDTKETPKAEMENDPVTSEHSQIVESQKQAEKPKSNAVSNDDPGEKTEVLTTTQRIARCKTLDELRSLCAEAEELKTDLEGTNLVFGVGNPNADLMIVGEAPGYNEDQQGEPFVGQAGQLLDKIMEAIAFKREDIYIANILKHRPPNNRNPKAEERQRSLPYLLRQIELIDPKLILCVGRVSATTLLDEENSLSKLRGKFHSFHGRELMATYHPAALLRNQKWKRPTWKDVQKLRKRYDELTIG